jgi:16S rRNA (uracil1498-N3)-methyltransferase
MQLFHNPDINLSANIFSFDKNESRHIIKVLRKKEKDQLQITNGKGMLFNSEIIKANDKKCVIQIISAELQPKPWTYHLHIAIAPTKMNDRYEWFLEKSTEIGIDEITPIICDNSERKTIKIDRFKKVIVSAIKQSLKYQLPILNDPIKFSEFIKKDFKGSRLIAHCDKTDRQKLKQESVTHNNITVLIGPEGDFSTKEINAALQHKFIPLSLGKSRLRTETAGIVVCNAISILKDNN